MMFQTDPGGRFAQNKRSSNIDLFCMYGVFCGVLICGYRQHQGMDFRDELFWKGVESVLLSMRFSGLFFITRGFLEDWI